MEKNTKNKVEGRLVRKSIITLFCFFIGISIAVIMFGLYNPSQNSLAALSSVCMDIVCIIMLFVLIGSYALDKYGLKRTPSLFVGLLLATTWAIFLDFLNWAFDGSLEFGHLTFWYTLGSLCMGSIMVSLFALYLYSYMEETHGLGKMKRFAVCLAVLNVASSVLTFILALTGTAFVFVDGHYETGALYDVVTVIPVLSLLVLTGYIIRYTKVVGIHDVFAVAGYICFMVAGAIIESVYSIGTTYVSVAIADIFIYVMLQNVIIDQEKQNAQAWKKQSNTDGLTGFLNRYAYENDIKSLEGEVSEDFVYVSMDVNSLKNINDTLGHSAGDELILGAVECMKRSMGSYGKLYRIGGDEFIALIYANDKQLESIKKDFEELAGGWSGKLIKNVSLSCGYVARREDSNMSLKQMAVLADQRMYEAKREYYERTGFERRRQ